MKAIIIAGGEGTRLRPLTYWKPKPLLPLLGKSLIERQIEKLREAGIQDIIINVGYQAESFENKFKNDSRITLSREFTPLGTAGAVKLAEPLFRDTSDVIVLNADILTTVDFRSLINYHRMTKSDVTLFSVKVEDPSRFGLILARQGYNDVEAFLEKMPLSQAQTYTSDFYINGGIYIMKSHLFGHFAENQPLSFEKEVFPTLIVKGYKVKRFDFDGYWLDIGTKEAYLKAHMDLIKSYGKL